MRVRLLTKVARHHQASTSWSERHSTAYSIAVPPDSEEVLSVVQYRMPYGRQRNTTKDSLEKCRVVSSFKYHPKYRCNLFKILKLLTYKRKV